MEAIIILCLVGLLGLILYIAYSLIRWIVKKKSRSLMFLGLTVVLMMGIFIHHLFFKKMEFIQSKVYPDLYLIKNPRKENEVLHLAIKEKTLEHLQQNQSNHEINTNLSDYSIKFYEYTKSWSIQLFADAGTAYFLENEEDPGGFVVEELGMYSNQLLAGFKFITCEKDTNSSCGELGFFKKGEWVKTDTLHQIFRGTLITEDQETHNRNVDLQKFQQLQNAISDQDELQFLNLFPSDFNKFRGFFGWNEAHDKPEIGYGQASEYISYFFQLIEKQEHQKFESKLISIAKNGKWQADAVNHFQDQAIDYFKKSQRYNLINELEPDEAKSVLFFLLDEPHPELDIEFVEGLNSRKMHIVYDLFANEFKGLDQPEPVDECLKYYQENEHFLIRTIDINKDNILDKVVSAVQYQGDELLLFVKKNGNYELALKTTNFSQDGGNQIVDIKAHEDGFIVLTAFLDLGFFIAEYYITLKQGQWILTKTVYRTRASYDVDEVEQVCEVLQDLNLADPDLLKKLKPIPEEGERNKLCTIL